jgi:trimethylamine--corrinoid protein Co-methyltransferase
MHQAVRPGAPVICSSSTTMMDLQRGEAAVGSPEMALFAAMNAQMAQFYGVPSWSGGT